MRTRSRDLLVPSLRKEANGRPARPSRGTRRRPRRRRPGDDQERERPAAQLRPAERPRRERRRFRRAAPERLSRREVKLPEGTFLEWTGQFEHEARARATLRVIVPLVLALIFLILYWTYHDLADAALMMLAVPGAIAGGVFFQWLFGFKFSVTVWVGYIACFGMATSTGIIMLVYLREAVAKAGGIARLDAEELRHAVLEGAVQPAPAEALNRGDHHLGLAPMLWATGVGAEVIKPDGRAGSRRRPDRRRGH